MKRLALGSGSPRRRELLSALGIPFDVVPSGADETLPAGLNVQVALEAVALRKARDVAGRSAATDWTLAADTAVVVADQVFGKPEDRSQAVAMLKALSGRVHQVITAVALLGPDCEQLLSVVTDVGFRKLTCPQIAWYTALNEPYDKAGGYAIQGRGAFMVAEIRGSYTNVVGLPMAETVDLLEQQGFAPWSQAQTGQEASGV